jgi:hypothetical protein
MQALNWSRMIESQPKRAEELKVKVMKNLEKTLDAGLSNQWDYARHAIKDLNHFPGFQRLYDKAVGLPSR